MFFILSLLVRRPNCTMEWTSTLCSVYLVYAITFLRSTNVITCMENKIQVEPMSLKINHIVLNFQLNQKETKQTMLLSMLQFIYAPYLFLVTTFILPTGIEKPILKWRKTKKQFFHYYFIAVNFPVHMELKKNFKCTSVVRLVFHSPHFVHFEIRVTAFLCFF